MEQAMISRSSCYPILQSSAISKNKISLSSRESMSSDARRMVVENAVIVFCRRGCCMSHVVKRLLQVLGVNPTVFEVDEEMESQLMAELRSFIINDDADDSRNTLEDIKFPAVFVGGKSFGSVERVVATHITGDLVPILKNAGALWL